MQVPGNDDYATQSIVLENEFLHVGVFPGCGGKIGSLRSKNPEVEWLWTHPTLALKDVNLQGGFDDNFYGGIDELFPNDLPTCVAGRNLPDHGELWRRRWELASTSASSVVMTLTLQCVPVRFVREICLQDNHMRVRTEIENLSDDDIPYLWAGHPAFRIDTTCELYIPGGRTIVQDEQSGRVKTGTPPFIWPGADLGFNLNVIPDVDNALEAYYITDVPEGRFQVKRRSFDAMLEVRFPVKVFPHIWLFLPLGGWRGIKTALLEAASGYPTDLAEAVHHGTHSTLAARQRVKAEFTYTISTSV